MSDFYVLSYLSTIPVEKLQGTGRALNFDDVRDDLEHAERVLYPWLRDHIADAVFFAICAEVRHLFGRPQPEELERQKTFQRFYRAYAPMSSNHHKLDRHRGPRKDSKFKDSELSYRKSYTAFKQINRKYGVTREQFAHFAAKAFREGNWSSMYGGKAWAQIAESFIQLLEARSHEEMAVAIDHAYDLQHNTGSVFTKLKTYYDYNEGDGYGWINKALNFKANIKSIRELVPKCSSLMKKLANKVLRYSGEPPDRPADEVAFANPSLQKPTSKVNLPDDFQTLNTADIRTVVQTVQAYGTQSLQALVGSGFLSTLSNNGGHQETVKSLTNFLMKYGDDILAHNVILPIDLSDLENIGSTKQAERGAKGSTDKVLGGAIAAIPEAIAGLKLNDLLDHKQQLKLGRIAKKILQYGASIGSTVEEALQDHVSFIAGNYPDFSSDLTTGDYSDIVNDLCTDANHLAKKAAGHGKHSKDDVDAIWATIIASGLMELYKTSFTRVPESSLMSLFDTTYQKYIKESGSNFYKFVTPEEYDEHRGIFIDKANSYLKTVQNNIKAMINKWTDVTIDKLGYNSETEEWKSQFNRHIVPVVKSELQSLNATVFAGKVLHGIMKQVNNFQI